MRATSVDGTIPVCLRSRAFVGAATLRGTVDLLPVQPSFDPQHYGVVAVVIIPVLLGFLRLRGAYDWRNLLGGPDGLVLRVSGDGHVRGYVPAATLAPREGLVFDLMRR